MPSPGLQEEGTPTGSIGTLGKEILIALSETLPFYIKHIQSVNGRETHPSLVVGCYPCLNARDAVLADCQLAQIG